MSSIALAHDNGRHRQWHRRLPLLTMAWALPACAGLGVGVAYTLTGATPAEGPSQGTGIPIVQLQSTGRSAHGPFLMSGAVTGLRPGVPSRLPVTVVNNASVPYRVLRISVLASGPRNCPAPGNLTVGGYDATTTGAPAVIVPAHGTALVQVPIALRDLRHNQNACMNAAFRLTYTGLASQGSHR